MKFAVNLFGLAAIIVLVTIGWRALAGIQKLASIITP